MKPVVDGCKEKATRLEKIFEKVVPQAGASRSDRYFFAVRTVGKGSRVESLMKGILEDVQLLAGNRVMRLATETSLRELEKAAEGRQVEKEGSAPAFIPLGHLIPTDTNNRPPPPAA